MNRSELIEAVSANSGESRRTADRVLRAAVALIQGELDSGGMVGLKGFGRFDTIAVAKKVGRNPRTGKEIAIPARRKPRFRVSPTFKRRLNAA